jgi:hypothetical protein
MPRSSLIICLTLVPLLISPSKALAHALGVSCKIRGDKVEVEAYYDDDSPAQNAKVQVVNARAETVADGVTDKDGNWSFPTPSAGTYEVRVNAGGGHHARKTITVPAAAKPSPTPDEPPPTPAEPTITDGPTRSEFTRTPWLQVAVGLLIIAGLGGVFLLASVLRKKA